MTREMPQAPTSCSPEADGPGAVPGPDAGAVGPGAGRPERKAPTGFIGNVGRGRPDMDKGWQTPPEILYPARRYWQGIPFDVCSSPENPTEAVEFWTPQDHALSLEWPDRWWCNPPYGGELRAWLEKAAQEAQHGSEGIALISASRWEQAWMQDVLQAVDYVCFIRGRVAFIRPSTGDRVGGNTYANLYLGFGIRYWRRWLAEFRRVGACFRLEGLSGAPGQTARKF